MENSQIQIVITKDGWTETLIANGKEYVKSYSRSSTGSPSNQIDWADDPNVPEMAFPAFNDLSAGCQEAMYVLQAHDSSVPESQISEVNK